MPFFLFLHRFVTAENHAIITTVAGFGNGDLQTTLTAVKDIAFLATHYFLPFGWLLTVSLRYGYPDVKAGVKVGNTVSLTERFQRQGKFGPHGEQG